MSFVLDASVALAWIFEDEATAGAEVILDRVAADGAVVPPVWPLEVGNALQTAVRRGRIGPAYRDAALAEFGALPITLDNDALRHAWTTSLALADAHGLSLYDATYLDLAERRQLPLATLDGALRRAAERLGRPLLGA